ncbi:MAG: YraN family protein [Actinomycetes bacterium]
MQPAGSRRELGAAGEDLAAAWYQERGYQVLARNWRCRAGELDLVLRRGRTYVFCEVKTRTTAAFGTPVEAVTQAKQARLRRLAVQWLREGRLGGSTPAGRLRFDVAAVLGGHIEVVEEAF